MGGSVCRLPVFVFSALVALSMVAAPGKKERSYLDTTWWDPYVENITDTDTYLRRKFRQDVSGFVFLLPFKTWRSISNKGQCR